MSALDLAARHPCAWGACDRVFLSADALVAHVAEHEAGVIPERRPELACRHCRSLQDTLEALYSHSVRQHGDPTQGKPHRRPGGSAYRFRINAGGRR